MKDKGNTRKRLIKAVGEVIKAKGFENLKISHPLTASGKEGKKT